MTFIERFPTEDQFIAHVKEEHDPYPVMWVTGGVAGGNCWNEGGHYDLEGEPEPELKEWDNILLDVFPKLSFIEYRSLIKKGIVQITDYCESEYYGNYTTGKKREIDLVALYRALLKM